MMAEKGSTERARRRGDEETGDRRPETGDRRPEKRRREEQEYSDQWREDVGKMMNQKRERRSII
ncbi:MAG TPA: hypothetical protein VGN15_11095 [Ktedonobacteraceae bacterium]|nr:hypothetical protein [Ktedonobacteraceae bacterium]